MNALKRRLYNIAQHVIYSLTITYYRCTHRNHRGKGYVQGARCRLMDYSRKPIGWYQQTTNAHESSVIDVSVIIPVYNMHTYLEECLQSIVHQQSHYKFEIICIDDGSTDESSDILETYASQYSCIKLFTQDNRGFSGARNRGLDEAQAKYVMFVDADDRLAPNAIERLMTEAEESGAEIVCCGFVQFRENGQKKLFCERTERELKTPGECMRRHQSYYWGKLFKRKLFTSIRLPEGYWFEDMQVFHLISRLCSSYSYIGEPLYEYRSNENGITRTAPGRPKAVDQYWMVEYIEEEFDRLGLKKDELLYAGLMRELGPFLFNRTKRLPEDIRQLVFSCASDRVAGWGMDQKQLSLTEKRLYRAFMDRSFDKWVIASSCWPV